MRITNVGPDVRDASTKSLESTLEKLSKAHRRMRDAGSSTTLVGRRRDAVRVGLDSLHEAWGRGDFSYGGDEIATSIDVLRGIVPSLEKQIAKARVGSSQRTLNERRWTAFELAIESLEARLSKPAC